MKKNIIFVIILFTLIGYVEANGNVEYNNIELNTTLEYFENNVTSILFKTKPGCTLTGFKFTDDYYKSIEQVNNIFVASNFEEYENIIKKYFEMDYFEVITQEFFIENILIVCVFHTRYKEDFVNSKFEKGDDNKFVYKIKTLKRLTLTERKCLDTNVHVLNMKKDISVN